MRNRNRLKSLLFTIRRWDTEKIFSVCVILSLFLHSGIYGSYLLSQLKSEEEVLDSGEYEDVDLNFDEIPPELLGGTSSPAPIEKQEWVEGSNKNKADEPDNSDLNPNQLSGNGTDRDGYLFSFNGDKPPTPIVDFNPRDYFPNAAKSANISSKTVVMMVQVNEDGSLETARIVSGKAGYGFDEAAMTLIKRVRFSPGYVQGKPKKMAHRMPILFSLEDNE